MGSINTSFCFVQLEVYKSTSSVDKIVVKTNNITIVSSFKISVTDRLYPGLMKYLNTGRRVNIELSGGHLTTIIPAIINFTVENIVSSSHSGYQRIIPTEEVGYQIIIPANLIIYIGETIYTREAEWIDGYTLSVKI